MAPWAYSGLLHPCTSGNTAAGGSTISDALHIALGIVTELLYLTVLALIAMATGKFMRSYSVFTFFVLLVFGFFTFPGSSRYRHQPANTADRDMGACEYWRFHGLDDNLFHLFVETSLPIVLVGDPQ